MTDEITGASGKDPDKGSVAVAKEPTLHLEVLNNKAKMLEIIKNGATNRGAEAKLIEQLEISARGTSPESSQKPKRGYKGRHFSDREVLVVLDCYTLLNTTPTAGSALMDNLDQYFPDSKDTSLKDDILGIIIDTHKAFSDRSRHLENEWHM